MAEQGFDKAALRELIKKLWPRPAGNELEVFQVGSGFLNTGLLLSNTMTPDMKAKQDLSSRPELAPQTNSFGLLLLNKYLINVYQVDSEQPRIAAETRFKISPYSSPWTLQEDICTCSV